MPTYEETLKGLQKKYGAGQSRQNGSSGYADDAGNREDSYESVLDSLIKKYSQNNGVNDRMDTLISDYNSFLDNSWSDYGSMDWKNSGEMYDRNASKIADLGKSAKDLYTYYFTGEGQDEAYATQYRAQLQQILDGLKGSDRDWQSAVDYYSQFEDEDSWNEHQKLSQMQEKYNWHTVQELETALDGMEKGEDRNYLSSLYDTMSTQERYGGAVDQAAFQDLSQKYEDAKAKYFDLRNQLSVYSSGGAMAGSRLESDPRMEALRKQVEAAKAEYDALGAQKEELDRRDWLSDKADSYRSAYDAARTASVAKTEEEAKARYEDLRKKWWQVEYALPEDDPERTAVYEEMQAARQAYNAFGNSTYRYINNIDGFRDRLMEEGSKSGHNERQYSGSPFRKYDYMTEDEIATYNYLYASEGKKSAEDYLEYLAYYLDKQNMQRRAQEFSEFADEHPVTASLESVATSLASGAGLVDAAIQKGVAGISGDYKPVNFNTAAMAPSVATQTIRGTVAQKIVDSAGTIQLDPEKFPHIAPFLNGKGWADVYQLGMSMADSLAVAGLSYLGIPGGTILLGGSAGTQGMLEAVERGATEDQAITMGILNGTFEALFEYVSLDKLLNGDVPKSALRQILEQAGVEASEEMCTTLANTFAADIPVMGDKSQLMQSVQEYRDAGLTEEEASRKAWTDWGIDFLWDGIGGALSGGLMAGGKTALTKVADSVFGTSYKAQYGSNAQALVNEALELDPENKAAQKAQNTLQKGGELSGRQIRSILQGIQTQDKAAIQTAAEQRLKQLGETGDVTRLSAALAKQAAGEKLNRSERRAIQFSHYGNQVAAELNPETKFLENRAPEWRQKIGTKRFNTDEYNRLLPNDAPAQEGAKVQQDAKISSANPGYAVSEDGKTKRFSTGEAVQIQEIESIDDGKMTFLLKDGSTVDASDIEYASEGEALIYEAVAGLDVGARAANILVKAFNTSNDVSAQDYALGIQEAFQYGLWNAPKQDLNNGPFSSALTEHQRNVAYENGRIAARQRAEQAQASRIKQDGQKAEGKVHFDGDRSGLNSRQRASLSALETVAKVLGVQIHVFESGVDADGKHIGENGRYVPEDGSIHIDLYSGVSGQDTMLFTAAHELTHLIRQWSPAKFKVLSDFLMEQYGKHGVSVRYLVEEQIGKAKRNGRTIDYDTAYEEVVADSMETMLADGNVVEKLAKLEQRDKSLWQKMKDYIGSLTERIRRAYAGLKPDSLEGRLVAQMKDSVEKLQELFYEGLSDAGESYQTTSGQENTIQEGGVQYQARVRGMFTPAEIQSIQSIGRKSVNSFTSADIKITEKFAKRYWKEMGKKSPFFRAWFGDWRVNDQTPIQIANQRGDARGVQHNDDTGWDIQVSRQVFNETQTHKSFASREARPYLQYINDIVKKAVLLDSVGQGKIKSENSLLMHSMYAVADTGNGLEVLKLYVEEMNDPNTDSSRKRSYQLQNMEKAFAASVRVQGGAPSSITNTANAIRTVADLFAAVKRMDGNFDPKPASKVVNADGKPMVVYHQTGNEFTVFDPMHAGAGSSDQQTPFGIFLKTSDKDIGVKGKKQMALYANIRNPLRALNRSDLTQQLKQLSADYATLCEDYDQMNAEFKGKQEAAGKALEDYMAQWRRENPKASRRDIYEDETFNKLSDAEDKIIDLWEQKDQELSTKAKTVITKALRDAGYDGVFLSNDTGSWGRKTDAIIALDPEQVKSATDNVGTFDRSNPDIRYSDRDPSVARLSQKQEEETSNPYSYESLTEKPDMFVTTVGGNIPKNRADVVQQAKQNAAKIGKFNVKDGSVSVHVKDTDTDVVLSTNGLKHGLDRRFDINAPVTLQAGEIISNSIQINELTPAKSEVDSSYVLIGAAKAENGDLLVVQSVVNRFNSKLETMDVLYAINAKKGNRLRSMRPGFQGPVTDSTISIAELLKYVNQNFPDVLPEDVLKHYGHDARPEGKLGESALYSDRDPSVARMNQALEKENTRLKEDVAELKKLLKLQKSLTHGTMFTKASVESMAGILMKRAGAKGARAELAGLLNEVYTYIARNEELTWEGVVEKAQPAVDWLQEHTQTVQRVDGYGAEVLRELRGSRIYLDENQKKEAAYQFGSFQSYRKQLFGTVTITDKNAVSLDTKWAELAEMYPNVFDAGISSQDQPGALLDAIGSLREMGTVDSWYDQEAAARDLLYQVYDGYWNVSTLRTVADVKQKQMDRLKGEHHARMDKLKAAQKEQLAKLKQEHREELRQVRQEYRANAEAKQQEVIQKYREVKQESFLASRDAEIMEREFLRLVRAYEKQSKQNDRDIADLEKTLRKEARSHSSESKTWEREFDRLLKQYEASDRNVKKLQEKVEAQRKSAKEKVESQKRTALRSRIQSVVKELNQYLLDGTKDKHVPVGLQKAVAEALDAVNMDTVGAEERIAKLKEELVNAKTPEKIQEISRRIDHVQSMGDNMKSRLQALKAGYEEIIHSDDPLIANAYDPGIAAQMMTLAVDVGDKPLRDMDLRQLEDVYNVYTMVLTTIRNANKAFKAARNATVRELGQKVMQEVTEAGGKRQYSPAFLEAIRVFGWNNLKPIYAFEHIGSGTFSEIFKNVRAGEDTWAVDVNEARSFFLEAAKKHGYHSWDNEKRYEFTSASGMKFSLNLEQIMSLYAYSKREQAADHLRKGGIVIDESTEVTMKTKLGVKVKFNPTEATAYNISDKTLAEITGKLTPEQKAYVDEMQAYLSSTMGEKGNEVSLQLYGIKLFKEANYFPLKSASQFMAKAKEQQQGEVKIKNAGFSKETVKHASNPVVLTPFMQVWADHVNEMSMYHAFVLPMEDFYRVYNYKTPTTDLSATESVEMCIQNAYGKGAAKYIDQLLKDLNGGARVDSTTGIINKSMNLFKKGAVFASASVVIQQPSAIARALSMIDAKYFAGPRVDKKGHKAVWEEVKHYAPVAAIKEMGYFDTNMGKSTRDYILGQEYAGIKEKAKALFTDSGYRDEALSKAPALADEITWCSIWEAVKRETKARNPGMDIKSEEFLKLAGERFTDVIVKTQVYDSVLSRSANMRSKDTGMKMATAFMAEPTTSINMVADALLKGKRGGLEGRRYCRRAIGSVVAAQVLNAILVSFVYAARDDDEDETYLEKYAGSFVAEVLDGLNPAGYIPFAKDIVSIVQGYDVERSDMAVISDLWNAWKQLGSDKLSGWRKVEGFAGSICQIFGLPLKNIMRDARGMYQVIDSFTRSQKTTLAGIGYAMRGAVSGKEVSDQEQLYQAYLKGDSDHIERVRKRYEDEASYNAALRAAVKQHFIAGDIDEATAQKYLIQYGGQEADEAYWTLDKWKYAQANGSSEDYTKYEKFYTAVQTGENIRKVIQEYTSNGVTEDTLASQITSHYKPEYVKLSAVERSNIKGYLVNALELCGMERDIAMERIGEWDFEAQYGFAYSDRKQAYIDGQVSAENLRKILIAKGGYTEEEADRQIEAYNWMKRNPQYDIDVNTILAYTQPIEKVGISVEASGIKPDTFVEYKKLRSKCKGVDSDGDGRADSGTVKTEVMEVIDSLPITTEQKDVLYYLNGWSKSTISEAPWR